MNEMEQNEALEEHQVINVVDKKKWYQGVNLENAELYIDANLKSAVRNVIAVGYYLKCVRDGELFREAGFETIWDYAKERYGFSTSTASRYMSRNDRFSKDGNSPVLAEQYKDFGKSQLQEMLSLDAEQLSQVTPDMTVQQIRDVRKPAPLKNVSHVAIPGQVELTDFPGITPETVEMAAASREERMVEPLMAEAVRPKQSCSIAVSDLIGGDGKTEGVAMSQQPEKTGKCIHRDAFNCTLNESDKYNAGNGNDCTKHCCWECTERGKCRLECYASLKRPDEDAAKEQQKEPETLPESSEDTEQEIVLSECIYDKKILQDMIAKCEEALKMMGEYWKENQPWTYKRYAMQLEAYQMYMAARQMEENDDEQYN